jgi:hypothetical protein
MIILSSSGGNGSGVGFELARKKAIPRRETPVHLVRIAQELRQADLRIGLGAEPAARRIAVEVFARIWPAQEPTPEIQHASELGVQPAGCGFRSGSTQHGWTSAWDGKKWLRRSARRDDVSWREDFGMAQTNGITA